MCAFLTSLLTPLVTGAEGSLTQNGPTRLYTSVGFLLQSLTGAAGACASASLTYEAIHSSIGPNCVRRASVGPSAQHEATPRAKASVMAIQTNVEVDKSLM